MNCKNCGDTLPENQTQCPNCGTENAEYMAPETSIPTSKAFSNKKNIIIIIVAAIILIAGAITAIAIGTSNSGTASITAQIELAEKYLSEQNYEQAVIEFQKAIEIDPMNVDAYIGLADAYIGLGDTEKAIEVLKQGIKKTGDSRLQNKLDKLLENAEANITTTFAHSNPVDTSAPEQTTAKEQTLESEQTTEQITTEQTSAEQTTANPAAQATETTEVQTTATQGTATEQVTSAPENVENNNSGIITVNGIEYDIATTTKLEFGGGDGGGALGDGLLNEGIMEIKDVVRFTNLEELSISYLSYFYTDISLLSNLTKLTSLYLPGNDISDISSLANLENLTSLGLHGNQISDISVLSGLTNLTQLDLSKNQITDISALSNLTGLTDLQLNGNKITDISALSNLTNLTFLSLDYGQISDISPLFNLTNLTTLILRGDSISETDFENLKSQLPNCKIDNY